MWRSHSGGILRHHDVTAMEATDFDAERPRLIAIATRILGSEVDADDVVQETWLRLSRTADIDNLPAWLTTVVTRLCLDQLRKRRTRSVAEAEAPPVLLCTGRPRGRRAARREDGRRDAGRPRRPGVGRESGVRPARCLPLPVRRDQRCHGAIGYRRAPAGEPGPAQGPGRARARRGSSSAWREPPRRRRVPLP